MFNSRIIDRTAIACGLACTLLAVAMTGAATALPNDLSSPDARDAALTSSFAGTTTPVTPWQDLRSPDARDAARNESALAQERYYSSYGDAKPLARPQSPSPSDDTHWLPIALAIAATLAAVALSAALLRRLRVRRRRAAQIAI